MWRSVWGKMISRGYRDPGDQAQTVTVTGEAPQVNTTNARLGGTIEEPESCSGRTYTGLLVLARVLGQARSYSECL